MRDQEIIGLQEAYLQVYAQPQEEVEQLDENRAAAADPEAYEEGQRRAQSRRRRAMNNPHTGINSPAFAEFMRKQMGGGAKPKEKEQKEEVEIDLFDYLLEYLVAEGYADTNKAALAIMANMSEEWKASIVEEVLDEAITSEKGKAKMKAMLDARTTASGRAKPGKGENVAQIKHIGRSEREGLRGTPMTPTMAKNPAKSRTSSGTGNRAARRAGTYED